VATTVANCSGGTGRVETAGPGVNRSPPFRTLVLNAAVESREMQIERFIWPEERIDHIARHGVTPEEVEEACFGKAYERRAKSEGENPVYYVLGQTDAGRYLFCVVIGFPDGNAYPVTAREMTKKEKRRFREWRDR
jgi:uncharacterized DUF497 family protein